MVLWTGADTKEGRKMEDTALVADPDPSPTYPPFAVRRSASSLRAAPTARSNSQSSRPANGGRNESHMDIDYFNYRPVNRMGNLRRDVDRKSKTRASGRFEMSSHPPDLNDEPTLGQILIDGATVAMLAATLWLLWLWAAALE